MMNNTEYTHLLDKYKSLIEARLSEILNPDLYGDNRVCDAMRYSLLDGGKRVRGILTLAFCDAVGGNHGNALDFACAIEMIHCYSLIHDDLPCMDDDDYRRGKPSCHKKYDEATALLAGDGLLTLAFEIMANTQALKSTAVLEGIRILSNAAGITGMIGGQMIDLQSENKRISLEQLTEMHGKKTGALIKAACQLGVIAGNGSLRDFTAATEYGQTVGLAFQIIDDILDVIADEEKLGKPVNSDKEKGKSNFISEYGLEKSREKAIKLTETALAELSGLQNRGFLREFTNMLLNRHM